MAKRKRELSNNLINRLPQYLTYLKELDKDSYVSALEVANSLNLNFELVKKDFQKISSKRGVPNKGRRVDDLINGIEKLLGFDENHRAILVGVGHLGNALLNYKGFKQYNLEIVGAFDYNKELIGKTINGINIYDFDDISSIRRKLNATIGIICVPASEAEGVAIRLVASGIEAIWNFAPVRLDVNDDVIVSNMDMAQSLANLAHRLYIKK